MQRPSLFRLPLVLLATLAATGCVTEPYSYLNGYRWSRVEINTYDMSVATVDGKSYPTNRDIMIDPGMHRIVFDGPPGRGFKVGVQRPLDIDIEPCTRYWFQAKKDNPLNQDFVPEVNYTEHIAGCHAPLG